jgi:hypothetical protein
MESTSKHSPPCGRVCAAIFEHSFMAGTLHIRPLLGFLPPMEALQARWVWLGKRWLVLSLLAGKHLCAVLAENFSNSLQNATIVTAIRVDAARNTTQQPMEQQKQTSRTPTRKGRKERTAEERVQKANGGGWNWKQWMCRGPSTLAPCLASRPPGKHFKHSPRLHRCTVRVQIKTRVRTRDFISACDKNC